MFGGRERRLERCCSCRAVVPLVVGVAQGMWLFAGVEGGRMGIVGRVRDLMVEVGRIGRSLEVRSPLMLVEEGSLGLQAESHSLDTVRGWSLEDVRCLTLLVVYRWCWV